MKRPSCERRQTDIHASIYSIGKASASRKELRWIRGSIHRARIGPDKPTTDTVPLTRITVGNVDIVFSRRAVKRTSDDGIYYPIRWYKHKLVDRFRTNGGGAVA